jgi:hypothetical protein
MKKRDFATVLSLFLLFAVPDVNAAAYGSGWYGEVQAIALHEDNISRSFKDEDQVSDLISSLSVGGGYSRKLGSKIQLILSGYATYSDHQDFSDLDNLAASFGMNMTYQPGAGYGAYWLGVTTNATWLKYDDSEAREGALFDLGLTLNRRFSTRTVGRVGYRYIDMVHTGRSSQEEIDYAAFDTATHEVFFGLDYELQQFVFLFAEYGFRNGGLTSTVSDPVPVYVEYEATSQDAVYDECELIEPGCTHRYAYRVVSDTHRLNLGIAFPIGNTNVDISASYFDAEAEKGGTRYKDWTVRMGLVWNF